MWELAPVYPIPTVIGQFHYDDAVLKFKKNSSIDIYESIAKKLHEN